MIRLLRAAVVALAWPAMGLALVIWALSAAPAFAGDGTTVSLAPIVDLLAPYAEAVASGAALAFVTWLVAALRRFFGLNMDARHREALHSAAMTGVRLGISSLKGYAAATPIELRSQILASAVSWMFSSVPGAVSHFGLSKGRLEELAESKLAEILIALPAADPSARAGPPALDGIERLIGGLIPSHAR